MEPKPGNQYSANLAPGPDLSDLTPQLLEMLAQSIWEIKDATGHGHIVLVIVDRRIKYIKVEKSFEAR